MPGPVRVLHLAAGNLFGGVETLLTNLGARRAGPLTLDSEFGLCFEGQLSEELRRRGASVHMLGEVRFRHPVSLARANLALSRVLRRSPYAAVVTHGAWPHLAFGACSRWHGTKLVTWGHGVPLAPSLLDRLSDAIVPDLLIANSQHTAQAIRHRFSGVPLEVIYAPVEIPLPAKSRAQLRRELLTPDSAIVIAFAARAERMKGHELLLRAAAALAARQERDWRLWLCGGAQRSHEQTYLRELKQFVASSGLGSRVSFLGQRADVADVFRAADIFCQPNSSPEPFGVVFVEALLAGLPVVATNMGGVKEIVDPSCGLLVEPTPAGIAAALERLITVPSLRQSLAQAAPARARQLCEPAARIDEVARAIRKLRPA
jgi:glycosyltransferase involved in cell wall biosynthesis